MSRRYIVSPSAWATEAIALVDESKEKDSFSVQIRSEGCTAWARLDSAEHLRRQRVGLGAITSTALLSSLWELPSGGAVPEASLSEVVVARLRSATFVVSESADGFTRTYAPIGTVDAVAFAGNRPGDVVKRAASFSPIVRRYAIVRTQRIRPETILCAQRFGVGLIVHDEAAWVVVQPSPPEAGRPHVYRWWLAEQAYAHTELEIHPTLQL